MVESQEQQAELQKTIDRLVEWSGEWQMLFNSDKCHILHLGGNNGNYEYTMGGRVLETVEYEKDVGVIVHKSLKPTMQCARAANRANAILGQLSRAVSYRDKDTFMRLYKVYVRPHLEYAVVSWSPWTAQDKEMLEKVQRRAVGMVSNIRGRTYEARLTELDMTTLADRRVRGDMIATYKIMSGKDKVDPGLFFDLVADGVGPRTRAATGAPSIRLKGWRIDIRKYSFGLRVTSGWNSLPDSLRSVGTVLEFKIGYDEWVRGRRLGE